MAILQAECIPQLQDFLFHSIILETSINLDADREHINSLNVTPYKNYPLGTLKAVITEKCQAPKPLLEYPPCY